MPTHSLFGFRESLASLFNLPDKLNNPAIGRHKVQAINRQKYLIFIKKRQIKVKKSYFLRQYPADCLGSHVQIRGKVLQRDGC